jgi:hypothetical protein
MRLFAQVAVVGVMLAGATRAEAQLPSVQQVYDKFATAVGGRAAWKPVTGRTEKGTADITFAGMSGSYERYNALPNKMRMIIDIGVVKIDQGFDGQQGWMSQGQGVQPMPAEQAKQMADSVPDGAAFLDPTRYAKAEVVGKEAFDGIEAYKVAITMKSGQESVEFFDVASGLRIGAINKTPAGEVRVTYRDYKEFEGKRIATKVIQGTAQGDVVLNIQAVSFGNPDAAVFKAPSGGL